MLGLGWQIRMKPDGSVECQSSGAAVMPAAAQACCEAVLCQLDSLADCLEVGPASCSLSAPCLSGVARASFWSLAAALCL